MEGIFLLIKSAKKEKGEQKEEATNTIVVSFVSFFEEMTCDDFRKLKIKHLEKALKKLVKLIDSCADLDQIQINSLFDLSLHLIKKDSLNQQLYGTDILNMILKGLDIENRFIEWSKQADIINYLVGKEFHKEITKRMQNVIKFYADNGLLTVEHADLLYQRSKECHDSYKAQIYIAISSILNATDEENAIEFLDNIFNDSQIYFSEFVIIAITQLYQKQKINHVIDLVFMLANSISIIPKIINAQTRQALIQNCITDLFQYWEIIIQLMKSSMFFSSEFNPEFKQSIFQLMHDHKDIFYQLVVPYYVKSKQKLTIEDISFVYEIDDRFWNLLEQIIQSNGLIMCITEESVNFLIDKLDSFDYSIASLSFSSFLAKFVIYINYIEGNISSHVSSFSYLEALRFNHLSKIGFIYAFKLFLQNQCIEIQEKAEQIILLVLTQIDEKYSNDLNEIILNDFITNTSQKVISLLFKVIKKVEKMEYLEDHGQMRHSERFDPSIITLILKGENFEHTIHSKKNVMCYELVDRIKSFIDENASVTFYGDSVKGSFSIDHFSICNNSVLKVKTRNKPHVLPPLPSNGLYHNDFTQNLISILASNADKEMQNLAFEFLQYLPTDSATEALTDNISEYIILLSKCSNSFELRYFLQISFIHFPMKTRIDGMISTLANILLSNLFEQAEDVLIHGILYFFDSSISDLIPSLFPKILQILIKNNDDDLFDESTHLLYKMAKKSNKDNLTEVINGNIELLRQVMLIPMTKRNMRNICRPILWMTDVTKVFKMVCKQLEDITKIPKSSARIFSVILTDTFQKVNEDPSLILERSLEMYGNAPNSSLASISQLINSIIDKKPELVEMVQKYSNNIINRAFSKPNEEAQRASFTLLNMIANYDLSSLFNIKYDRWNHSIDDNKKSKTGYCGLYNMGATCFLNSIMQQTFFTYPFRYLILTQEYEKEDMKQLQLLYANLAFSEKKYVETKGFIKEWRGWGKQQINPKEQQDANEFFNMFIDQLPEEHQQIFQGNCVNRIQGIDDEYESMNIEPFSSICLVVQDSTNVYQSLDLYINPEFFVGENKINAEKLGRKIDAKKFSKIGKTPPVLVIQLKRFEYDFKKWERYKINDHFEFPQNLDLNPYLDEPYANLEYILSGIVLHSGTAQGGHYFSYIRFGKKWLEFNDTVVSEIDENIMLNKAYGGKGSSTCAYMLFYRQVDAKINELDLENEPKISPLEGLIDPIHVDNEEFNKINSLFTETVLYFIRNNVNDAETVMKYYTNVFLHSAMKGRITTIETKVFQVINDKHKEEWFFKYLEENFDTVLDIYLNCPSPDMLNSLTKILKFFITSDKLPLNLMSKIIENSSLFIHKTSQYSKMILELPYCYLQKQDNYEAEMQWSETLINSIGTFYHSMSIKAAERADLTSIFNIISFLPVFDLKIILDKLEHIMASSFHIKSFFSFITKSDFNLELIFNVFKKQKSFNQSHFDDFIIKIIQNAATQPNISLIVKNCLNNRISKVYSYQSLVISINNSLKDERPPSLLRENLFKCFKDIIVPLLTALKRQTRQATLELIRDMIQGDFDMQSFVDMLFDIISSSIDSVQLLYNSNSSTSPEESAIFDNYMKLFRLALDQTEVRNNKQMDILIMFFDKCLSMNQVNDYNLFYILKVMSFFPNQDHLIECIKKTFERFPEYNPKFISCLSYILSYSDDKRVFKIYQIQEFRDLLKSLIINYPQNINLFKDSLNTVIPMDPTLKDIMFIIFEHGIENRRKIILLLMKNCFDDLNDQQINEILSYIFEVVSVQSNDFDDNIIPKLIHEFRDNIGERYFDVEVDPTNYLSAITILISKKISSKIKDDFVFLLHYCTIQSPIYQVLAIEKCNDLFSSIRKSTVKYYDTLFRFYFMLNKEDEEHIESFVTNIIPILKITTWIKLTRIFNLISRLPASPARDNWIVISISELLYDKQISNESYIEDMLIANIHIMPSEIVQRIAQNLIDQIMSSKFTATVAENLSFLVLNAESIRQILPEFPVEKTRNWKKTVRDVLT